MKIAQIAPLFESVPPQLYGGTERVVSFLTEELVRLGHEVTLFASGDSATSARLVPGCSRAMRLSGCVDPVAPHLVMLERVFAQKEEFDILHFHVDYLHFPFSKRENVPSVTTLHGRLDIPALGPLYKAFPEMPVISISKAQRTPLPFANWVATVHHGLPVHRYPLGRGEGKYLAFLGRTSPEKGLDQAIDIASRAGIPLRIAAKVDPADKEYFESEIRPLLKNPLVEFIGEIGYPTTAQFLGDAMGLLFPINWPEPFGLVMIEALACGTPVIAYPRGSVREVIEDGKNGCIVSDVPSAVRAIGRLPEISRQQCRRSFEERFSSRRMAQDYVDIYERLVSQVPQPMAVANAVYA